MNSIAATTSFRFRRDLARWRQLVAPAWLHGLVSGTAVDAAPAGAWRLFECGFAAIDAYVDRHIPGAGYIDTNELEHGPLWNKVPDAELERVLLSHGIRHDVTVILYARNLLAAARVAHLLLYAGVADVRLLDGGFDAWRRAGFACEHGAPPSRFAVPDFGAALPVRPDYLFDMQRTRDLLRHGGGTLVSTRSWNEFIGKTSGYGYIEARGDIAGAVWGRAGDDDDVNSMSEFHDADGCMKPAAAIRVMWGAAGIHPGRRTVFYCGTGWRASLAFFYAWLMDWEHIAVYDGGWCEWSRDAENAVVRRVDDCAQGRDSGSTDADILAA